jgi:hypothetical protein
MKDRAPYPPGKRRTAVCDGCSGDICTYLRVTPGRDSIVLTSSAAGVAIGRRQNSRTTEASLLGAIDTASFVIDQP